MSIGFVARWVTPVGPLALVTFQRRCALGFVDLFFMFGVRVMVVVVFVFVVLCGGARVCGP